MSVKVNVFNNRKNKYEEINSSRNGDLTQYLTNIDLHEIVTSGEYIVKIHKGNICHNLEFNPFERFIIEMTAKRIGFTKQGRALSQTLSKKCSNSLYGV